MIRLQISGLILSPFTSQDKKKCDKIDLLKKEEQEQVTDEHKNHNTNQ